MENELSTPDMSLADNPFRDKKFTNVSFKDTTITGINFFDCIFVDCLFINTRFVDCEFHGCAFEDCNPHKIEFINTYIDPSIFEDMVDSDIHQNIGMHLFQALYANSWHMRQIEFVETADFNRQIWTRHVLNERYKDRKRNWDYIRKWLPNFLSHYVTGYGLRVRYLAQWAIPLVVLALLTNFFFWDTFDVVGRNGQVEERGFIEVLYYTVTLVGGVGHLTPESTAGRVAFMLEALAGLLVVSLLVRWIVKRALR